MISILRGSIKAVVCTLWSQLSVYSRSVNVVKKTVKHIIRSFNNFEPYSGSYLSRVSREARLLRERD